MFGKLFKVLLSGEQQEKKPLSDKFSADINVKKAKFLMLGYHVGMYNEMFVSNLP